jgi:mRNA-degrading endonuclease RelE of RelBE toxin-antitoxin system
MEFRIADTFTDSLSKLTGQEQKNVKTTAFDLQLNPASQGMRFHKLDRAKDPNFWSVSVNMDIRLIVHRTDKSLLLCYVDHHDAAYAWASRRKIENHPKTGAAQLVEVRERVEEVIAYPAPSPTAPSPTIPPIAASKPLLFITISDDDLLSYGVPIEWLPTVRQSTEDSVFKVVDRLPQEAAEALLELATGGTPQKPTILPANTDPFNHPDAQRRFRVMTNLEELEQALAFPWEKWTVFLHPAQRALVERNYKGAARVSGSAGTGKTIVALHRTVFLARNNPRSRILLSTFSDTLANALQVKLKRLIGNDVDLLDRIQVRSLQTIAQDIYVERLGQPTIVEPADVRSVLQAIASQSSDHRFSPSFLFNEWTDVVDAWQLDTWASYRDVPRLGRKTRMGTAQREKLWSIFSQVQTQLDHHQQITVATLFSKVAEDFAKSDDRPFDFIVVDEAQDIGIAELRFLAALGDRRPDSLFFTGDLGQRIFQQPFSWKALGVDIRGRSQTLTINYRTSHQIRTAADRLLPSTLADVDGNIENRRNTISVFNGPAPKVELHQDSEQECQSIGQWITEQLASGLQPDQIGIFVRDRAQLNRAIAAIQQAGATPVSLNNLSNDLSSDGCIAVSTMHLAKGLEFAAVAVMACDDEVLPLQSRIEAITDESDLEEVYNTERHLLYVACTRARDSLLISGVEPASEFLGDLNL